MTRHVLDESLVRKLAGLVVHLQAADADVDAGFQPDQTVLLTIARDDEVRRWVKALSIQEKK